jgi:hypothetical protein
MAEKRKRYLDHKEYITPKVAERAARVGGNLKESEFEEVDVIDIDGPDGEPKRITKDQRDAFKNVHKEMADTQAKDSEMGPDPSNGDGDEGHKERE